MATDNVACEVGTLGAVGLVPVVRADGSVPVVTAPRAGPSPDVDPAGGRVVADGVVDQVRHETFDQPRASFQFGRVERGVHQSQAAALDLGTPSRKHAVGHHRQLNGLAPVEIPSAAGQAEQRLDQLLQLLLRRERAFVGRAQRRDAGVRVGERHLNRAS